MSTNIPTSRLFIFLTIVSLLGACKDTNSRQTGNTGTVDTLKPAPPVSVPKTEPITLYAWVDRLRVRKEADKKAEILEELEEGAALRFLNEKSDFTEKINLRGTLFDEPWLKVETAKGNTGWIYGGGVKFYAPQVDQSPSPYDDCYVLRKDRKGEQVRACMERVKREQLKKHSRWVEETERKVAIRLLDGSWKEFETQDSEELEEHEYQSYEYRYYIPQMGYHVLKLYGHEWSAFLLVNDKSGNTIEIHGYPKASPDHRHLIATNADLEAGFEFNGIQLYGFTQNGLEKLFEEEMSDYEPVLPVWLDEQTVEITFLPSVFDEERKAKKVQLVEQDAGLWVFKE